MKDARVIYSGCAMALTLTLANAAVAAPLTLPPPKPGATMAPATTGAINAAEAPAAYPTFASIPARPTDVRPLAAWKTAVLTVQDEGARLNALADIGPWTLADTEAWAETERAAATAPPPTAAPTGLDTEAYAALMRQRATPPPPGRHGAEAHPAHP
jgi:hypothetical protein